MTQTTYRICVLEDNHLLLELLVGLINDNLPTCSLTTCTTMAELVDQGLNFDFLVSDLDLPDSPAHRTAQYLEALPVNTQIACFTADERSGRQLEQRTQGRIRFFSKTGSMASLLSLIKSKATPQP
ncbi:MAG TPA: hypothetical protein VFX23_07385 [Limnobacter sp.]|uniref:hypothetical protein n=1 Tax=Limnobacter sp. TaxID=2003368 RepID=UPI002E36B456|nr:hypothetical protein [Limnobacter sp.]HEX5485802.1 hypothetical protein [Limnobacter sp.]